MSYDFHGAWEDITGLNSPIYGREGEAEDNEHWNVAWAANFWAESGMPRHKIVVGIPAYGRGWTLKDPANDNGVAAATVGPAKKTKYVREAGVASYYEICGMLQNGAKRVWHEEHSVPYLIAGDQWFGYDDAQSVSLKVDLVKRGGYGGVFVWTLDFDDFSGEFCGEGKYPLIQLIRDQLASTFGKKIRPKEPVKMKPTKLPTQTPRSSDASWTSNPCKAKSDGFYPYGDDTKPTEAFLLCLTETPFTMMCPPGLALHPVYNYCTYSSFASGEATEDFKSRTDLPWTDFDAQDTTRLPDVPLTMSTRVWETYATTERSSVKNRKESEGRRLACYEDGFYRYPGDCNKFYRCVSHTPYTFVCPHGLVFDKAAEACDYPSPFGCLDD